MRPLVHEDWGFAAQERRAASASARCSAGESGTGKTLAAEVLARELDLDLYRIDLSAVVSASTSARPRRTCAGCSTPPRTSGAILLFDEADALFGKRSEVKDSHDRYANIEVSYLLQRMEAYRGLAILTTNQKAALDPAFLRRLRFIVHFPFPDAAKREAIWRATLPAALPLERHRLRQARAAGGGRRRRSATSRSAPPSWPPTQASPVTMAHLLARGADGRGQARRRRSRDAETRGWV